MKTLFLGMFFMLSFTVFSSELHNGDYLAILDNKLIRVEIAPDFPDNSKTKCVIFYNTETYSGFLTETESGADFVSKEQKFHITSKQTGDYTEVTISSDVLNFTAYQSIKEPSFKYGEYRSGPDGGYILITGLKEYAYEGMHSILADFAVQFTQTIESVDFTLDALAYQIKGTDKFIIQSISKTECSYLNYNEKNQSFELDLNGKTHVFSYKKELESAKQNSSLPVGSFSFEAMESGGFCDVKLSEKEGSYTIALRFDQAVKGTKAISFTVKHSENDFVIENVVGIKNKGLTISRNIEDGTFQIEGILGDPIVVFEMSGENSEEGEEGYSEE